MNNNKSSKDTTAVVGAGTEARILEWRGKLLAGDPSAPWPLTPPRWVREVEIFIDSDSAMVEYFGRPHRSGRFTSRVRQAFMVDAGPENSIDDAYSAYEPAVEIELPSDPNLSQEDAADYARSIGDAALELATIGH